jgi:hypothetical protein
MICLAFARKVKTTMNPSDPTRALSPDGLANQLFDAAIVQYKNDPREAARQVIIFLTEAIIYAVVATAGDDVARKALLKSVGETITNAPMTPNKATAGKP